MLIIQNSLRLALWPQTCLIFVNLAWAFNISMRITLLIVFLRISKFWLFFPLEIYQVTGMCFIKGCGFVNFSNYPVDFYLLYSETILLVAYMFVFPNELNLFLWWMFLLKKIFILEYVFLTLVFVNCLYFDGYLPHAFFPIVLLCFLLQCNFVWLPISTSSSLWSFSFCLSSFSFKPFSGLIKLSLFHLFSSLLFNKIVPSAILL